MNCDMGKKFIFFLFSVEFFKFTVATVFFIALMVFVIMLYFAFAYF